MTRSPSAHATWPLACLLAGLAGLLALSPSAAEAAGKKVVLIAGKKSHGPGHHEYERGCKLLARCLEQSAEQTGIRAEVCLEGWPQDESTLEDADAILVFCDGSDHNEQDHPLLREDRLKTLDKLMARGVGLLAIHYTVFVPGQVAGDRFLDWIGGYFDYETGPGERHWFSKIATHATRPEPNTKHPIGRGLTPFDLTEEYYYNIRFGENDDRRTPILTTAIPGEEQAQVVAWARERENGGRGFGFTGGHFHSNWGVENFRKLVLNAILWTAHVEVPEQGVQSTITEADLAVPDTSDPQASNPDLTTPIRTLILTGHNHPAHDWRVTTKALQDILARDPRFQITVIAEPERIAGDALADFDLIVQNYVNWERPGLGAEAQQALLKFVADGKGLAVIHFANGAFLDWPEYRKLARRVWIEGKSGHDAYGAFRVEPTEVKHPITEGLAAYDTTDELYYSQQGELPIEPLLTAKSNVTGQNEPMAFVYPYEKGSVFQTVLGHDAKAIRSAGTSELIRRGCAWAAGRKRLSFATRPETSRTSTAGLTTEGRFGRALDPTQGHVGAAPKDEYQAPPLTVECWAKLRSKNGFNILVANGPKESSTHWELYSYAGSGTFSAYLPGFKPAEIVSDVEITDDKWHHLAMVWQASRVRLFVDGQQVREAAIEPAHDARQPGALYFGAYPAQSIGCDGLLDEVRISRGAQEKFDLPQGPFTVDDHTIGLWHFDELDAPAFDDASTLNNDARPDTSQLDASSYQAVDKDLQVVLLDRSPKESFLSMRADSTGRLFVGGREALFVYEPDPNGAYLPRRELYRFPPHTWLTDIEIRGDDLYVNTASAIYLLPGARTKREDIQARRLIWGWPVDLHVTLHGLAWGPEGDLYFAAGDPLLNYGDFTRPDHWGHWTVYSQPEGTRTPYTGAGGVFRCRPDGSSFQVVARGTRGSDGLCFDHDWNLFTNDNDHESLPAQYVPARLLHVTYQADFAWPRGWLPNITPERADLLEIVNTGMGRGVPVNQAYYDEPGVLPSAFQKSLLVARWDQRSVAAYGLRARGASFEADESLLLLGQGNARPVGVTVGRGGRVFAAISYMAQNEGSPTYASDLVMIAAANDAANFPFDARDVTTSTRQELLQDMTAGSWTRRQQAHQEWLRRGESLRTDAGRWLANDGARELPAAHLYWLLCKELGESSANWRLPDASTRLVDLLDSLTNREDRWQLLRALAEFAGKKLPRAAILRRVPDGDARIRLAALHALWSRPGDLPDEVLQPVAQSPDSYLRQMATMLVGVQASQRQLQAWSQSAETPIRLACALAAGFRLTMPNATAPLDPKLPLKYFSENAMFDIAFAAGRDDLKQLGPVGSFTLAERWQALEHTADEESTFALLAGLLSDPADSVRLQAAHFLALLNDPRTEPTIAQVRQESSRAKLAQAPMVAMEQAWVVGPFPDIEGAPLAMHPPEQGAIDLAAEFQVGGASLAWQVVNASAAGFDLPSLAGNQRGSCYVYARLQSASAQRVLLLQDRGTSIKLWHNGRPLLVREPLLVDLQPGTNDLLLRVPTAAGSTSLQLQFGALGDVTPGLAEKLGLGTLAERLKAASTTGSERIAAEFAELDWASEIPQGDAVRGRKLFGADALGCVKCHAIAPDQTGAGAPSLAGAARRFTISHLVESVLLPSKQVAPNFRSTSIETSAGEAISGLVIRETETELELLLNNAARKTISKREIDRRELSSLSPMPLGVVKTPDELRDLLAYLLSENPTPP